jgi:hypothetical protein
VPQGGIDFVLQMDQDATALDPRPDGVRGLRFPETADAGQRDVEGLDADMSEDRVDITGGALIPSPL